MKTSKIDLRKMVLLALFGSLMEATKIAMTLLPNIHLVSMFIILAAMLFGWESLYSVYIFVALDVLINGAGLSWVIGYLYIWAILDVVAVLFRGTRSRVFWAMVSGIFGLLFGTLFTPAYMLTEGWASAAARWVSGIPFDLVHCVSNAILTFVLLMPLYHLCTKLLGPQKRSRTIEVLLFFGSMSIVGVGTK